MLRLILIALFVAVAVAWLEPGWDEGSKTFSVRVRNAREVGDWIASVAGPLNERYSELLRPDATPPVASAPPARSSPRQHEIPQEQLTREERKSLDRLIEEKTRER